MNGEYDNASLVSPACCKNRTFGFRGSFWRRHLQYTVSPDARDSSKQISCFSKLGGLIIVASLRNEVTIFIMRSQFSCVATNAILLLTILRQALGENYCGSDFSDAKKCQDQCPAGLDGDCPPGETCYAHVPCPSSAPIEDSPLQLPSPSEGLSASFQPSPTKLPDGGPNSQFCGKDYASSVSCEAGCISGMDSECPENEHCFTNVMCVGRTPPFPVPSVTATNDPPSVTATTDPTSLNRSHLSTLEAVGIVAGVIASLVTVEETLRRCFWKKRALHSTSSDGSDHFQL